MIRLLMDWVTMPLSRESRRVDALLTRDAEAVRAAWEQPADESAGPPTVARIGPAVGGAGLAAAAVVGLAIVLPNLSGVRPGERLDPALVAQVAELGDGLRAAPVTASAHLTEAARRPILALKPATAPPIGRDAAALATGPMEALTADVETSLRAIARQFPELQRLRAAEQG